MNVPTSLANNRSSEICVSNSDFVMDGSQNNPLSWWEDENNIVETELIGSSSGNENERFQSSQSDIYQVEISWATVVNKFISQFERGIVRSLKVYFDCLPMNWSTYDKLVDGARSKWSIPLLLDAIIYLHQHCAFDLSKRRSFNQHKVLFDCIWETVAESIDMSLRSATESTSNHRRTAVRDTIETILRHRRSFCQQPPCNEGEMRVSVPTSSNQEMLSWMPTSTTILGDCGTSKEIVSNCIRIVDVDAVWQDLHLLLQDRVTASYRTKSKSHKKFLRILKVLIDHPLWQGQSRSFHSLLNIYRQVSLHALLWMSYPVGTAAISVSAFSSSRTIGRQTTVESPWLSRLTSAMTTTTTTTMVTAADDGESEQEEKRREEGSRQEEVNEYGIVHDNQGLSSLVPPTAITSSTADTTTGSLCGQQLFPTESSIEDNSCCHTTALSSLLHFCPSLEVDTALTFSSQHSSCEATAAVHSNENDATTTTTTTNSGSLLEKRKRITKCRSRLTTFLLL